MSHRLASKFGYYSLSSFAGSALVQLAVIWPQTWIAVGALGLLALVYFAFLLICIYGVLKGTRWAGVLNFNVLGIDAIESTVIVLLFLVGGLWTCLEIL
ncbi:MAG: hypothetical protein AB8B99_15615 [Phormidesmis sp.]